MGIVETCRCSRRMPPAADSNASSLIAALIAPAKRNHIPTMIGCASAASLVLGRHLVSLIGLYVMMSAARSSSP